MNAGAVRFGRPFFIPGMIAHNCVTATLTRARFGFRAALVLVRRTEQNKTEQTRWHTDNNANEQQSTMHLSTRQKTESKKRRREENEE